MKTCTKCNELKPLTEYWKSHGGRYYKSTCKPCTNKLHKKWLKTKPKYQQKYTSKWQKENRKSHLISVEKKVKSIPAGVYEILYKGKRIYVGESKKPYARIYSGHFTNHSNLDRALKQGPVAYKLSTGKIKREDLSYNMLDYIDDDNDRLEVEQRYIDNSTGLWNTIHN